MRIFWLILLSALPMIGLAQSYEVLYARAQKLETELKEKEAFETFVLALNKKPNDAFLLSKCSELASRLGARESSNQTRDNYYRIAFDYATASLREAPNKDWAHIAMAIALGKTALTKGAKEKIKYVKEVRSHAETAVKLNPHNFVGWHILGRWQYEVANAGALEMAAAKLFFGGIPKGSFENAVMYFEKSKTENPKFILNYIEMAKAYNKVNNKAKAIEYLKTAINLPNTTADDANLKNFAAKLLKQLAD